MEGKRDQKTSAASDSNVNGISFCRYKNEMWVLVLALFRWVFFKGGGEVFFQSTMLSNILQQLIFETLLDYLVKGNHTTVF